MIHKTTIVEYHDYQNGGALVAKAWIHHSKGMAMWEVYYCPALGLQQYDCGLAKDLIEADQKIKEILGPSRVA